ncbi:FkbM family methyltransferase [Dyadobacter frigoris]|uniref:FkbM family methyltransferase n=1 Tax=Dyadobacter frigoris TaxID=2576211 RepID=UPI001484E3BA|nr:FkbM family methyltransferase [Dyadobacter frigoris]GLU52492.1 hypothetical protein Dfri01_19530 [Dyadobacter frigoris]
MLDYLKKSFARKKARRQFQEYSHTVDKFVLPEEGEVEFANWDNPLVKPVTLTQDEINFFKKFIPRGSFCIDIGTNIGDTTVPMAVAAGKTGTTLGFDPNPHVFKILEANVTLNKEKTNIIPFNYAITKEDGEFYYSSSEASFGNGGISNEIISEQGEFQLPQKIKGINLQNFLEKNYADLLPKLSFIKVDVEGADKEVIRSISELLIKYKPVLIAEVFSKSSAEDRTELFDLVASLGYTLYYFSDFVANAEIIKLESGKDLMKWKMLNFYAVPN